MAIVPDPQSHPTEAPQELAPEQRFSVWMDPDDHSAAKNFRLETLERQETERAARRPKPETHIAKKTRIVEIPIHEDHHEHLHERGLKDPGEKLKGTLRGVVVPPQRAGASEATVVLGRDG